MSKKVQDNISRGRLKISNKTCVMDIEKFEAPMESIASYVKVSIVKSNIKTMQMLNKNLKAK